MVLLERGNITLMIPKKFEIIRLKSCKSWSMVQAAHNTGLSTIHDIKEQTEQL
jgi:hypothetical protein